MGCSGSVALGERHDACVEGTLQGQIQSSAHAERTNSSIQGSTVYLDDSSARLDARLNSRVERARERGEEGGNKDTEYSGLLEGCEVGELSTMAATRSASRDVGVPGCYLQVG